MSGGKSLTRNYSKADHKITNKVVMETKNISKSFPGVKALNMVNMQVHEGEVVALLGENGAGKSTLIKVLSGIHQADEGQVFLNGKETNFQIPLEAINAGIGVIHQELNYVPSISIAENIFMGNIPKKYGIVDYKKMYEKSKGILSMVGLELEPTMLIGNCSVAEKQLIEIAKVMSNDIKVLILDEPTSSLNDVETRYLFELIHKAAASGTSILYISHKLDELFEVTDRVIVMRDGCVTGEFMTKEATKDMLISRMVGRDITSMYSKQSTKGSDTVLEIEDLSTEILKSISFKARKGEIFGIYGLMGSGHQEVGPSIFGQDNLMGGTIRVNGKKVNIKEPMDAINNGIAYVPVERKSQGLVLNQSVAVNIMTAFYSKKNPFFIKNKLDSSISRKWINNLKIKTPSGNTQVESLSGGNQQKVVLSKWLELEPDILILNEPTRGIDVGAKTEIYKILDELCMEGKCIIIITSEMQELLSMSDRIMVMFEGKVSAILDAHETTQELVVKYAIGG